MTPHSTKLAKRGIPFWVLLLPMAWLGCSSSGGTDSAGSPGTEAEGGASDTEQVAAGSPGASGKDGSGAGSSGGSNTGGAGMQGGGGASEGGAGSGSGGVVCGEQTCGPNQYCRAGCSGIGGPPGPPYCVDVPPWCSDSPTCECVCGISSFCVPGSLQYQCGCA
jgi:hypothetical protein